MFGCTCIIKYSFAMSCKFQKGQAIVSLPLEKVFGNMWTLIKLGGIGQKNNYLGKVIERSVAEQLQGFLDETSAFDPFQSGFRPGFRVETNSSLGK